MKLTRGTDGNWSYQYVADIEDIAKKEEDLAKIEANTKVTISTEAKAATARSAW